MIKTKFLTRFVAVVAMLSLVTACNDDIVNEYCNYRARLVYYGATTVLQPLNDALGGANTFAFVSMEGNSAKSYYLKANLKNQSQEKVLVQVRTEAGEIFPTLGLENSRGFIIGRSSNAPEVLYVFDRVCPNCYKEHRDTRYILNFKDDLTVKCTENGGCGREYSLLNGGLVVSTNNGEKLFRYRATADGFTLKVVNN